MMQYYTKRRNIIIPILKYDAINITSHMIYDAILFETIDLTPHMI